MSAEHTLTVRIGDAGGACFAGCPTRHRPDKVEKCHVFVLLLVLVLGQTLLEKLVDDKVNHCLTNPPPGGCQSLPETEYTTLGAYPPYHHGKTRMGPVKLQPSLH